MTEADDEGPSISATAVELIGCCAKRPVSCNAPPQMGGRPVIAKLVNFSNNNATIAIWERSCQSDPQV